MDDMHPSPIQDWYKTYFHAHTLQTYEYGLWWGYQRLAVAELSPRRQGHPRAQSSSDWWDPFSINLSRIIISTQCVNVTNLMSVTQSDPELSHGDHFLFRVGQIIVKVTSNDVHIRRYSFKVVKGLSCAEVARAKDVLDPSGWKQLPELGWKCGYPVRNVQVSQNQDELNWFRFILVKSTNIYCFTLQKQRTTIPTAFTGRKLGEKKGTFFIQTK